MTNHPNRSKNPIVRAVNEFFGSSRAVYATPGTDNHSANFYGDHDICRLTRSDVIACIETARDNWVDGDADYTENDAIRDVLDDLQYTRPV